MNAFEWSRRGFVKACGAVAACAAAGAEPLARPAFALDNAPELKLVDKTGKPIKAGGLATHANYIFAYPYVSTPCLLLRLGAATPRNLKAKDAKEASYIWPGGVGRDRAVVAYSAICAHAFTYNSKATSFLRYSKSRTELSAHTEAITCCAHASVYDPARGAKVVSGPAAFPLAAVQLKHDTDTDELSAVGLVGTTLFHEFFKAYRADLNAEYGRGRYREVLRDRTTVLPMGEYSKDVVKC